MAFRVQVFLGFLFERSSIFFLFPTPHSLVLAVKKFPARVLFPFAHLIISKEKIEFLWTGYTNSSCFFVTGCCVSILLCVPLAHDYRVSRAPYFWSCVAVGYESPIFHRASEILKRAWKSPPVRNVTCWPAQILPWGKMWGEGGGHAWIPLRSAPHL